MRVGAARVCVPDLRGEEFEEATGGAGAGCGEKGRGASVDNKRELVHGVVAAALRSSIVRKR